MNDILAVYLKAYTSKRAADSVADDIAVGAGSGLLGGLVGYTGGKVRGERLRDIKAPQIERILNRISSKLNNLEPKIKTARRDFLRRVSLLHTAKNRGYDTSWIESLIKKDSDSIDKLEPLAKKNKKRYLRTWGKASKLQKAIKNSKRLGGVAGAASASILGPILYNTLKKD